jgi:VWFA-related protein
MQARLLLAASLAWVSCCLTGHAATQDHAQHSFASETSAIIVDVVVRDKQGEPVTDLTRQDFRLFEDGVPQDIGDVTLVAPGGAPRTEQAGGTTLPALTDAIRSDAAATTPLVTPTAPPDFVALVFDRLSPEARAFASRGARAYVRSAGPNTFTGVFVSDLSLETIQPYTADTSKVSDAIERVATRATANFTRDDPLVRGIGVTGDPHPRTPFVAGADSPGRPIVPNEEAEIALVTARNSWEALDRDSQGYATTNALLAIATGLGALPGRKTVVFFAEGLALPPNVLPAFQNVVATANRNNVSFYTVDAAGLRVHSEDAATGREVQAMGLAGIQLSADGSSLSNLAMLERNEDALRKDPRTSLTMLAQQTGGFLVDDTNDLNDAVRRIGVDRRFHYLLTYVPKNGDLDGKWRTLSVKVPGRSVEIRSRSGYFAVRTPRATPLLAYELPALAALEHGPLPSDLPIRTGAFAFPTRTGASVVVLASTDAAALTFTADQKTHAYRTDFTVLARIRDASGAVVRMASQPYRLSGPLTDRDRARRGEVLFFRQPSLEAGAYTIESAAYDAPTGHAGTQRRTFEVPPPGPLSVGSLIVVKRGERLPAAERIDDNPLAIGDVLIYPNLGEPIRKADRTVTLFVTIFTASHAPTAALDVIHDGVTLSTLPVVLDAPDAKGRVQQLIQLPIVALPIGESCLRLRVAQGSGRATREANLNLTE